LKDLIGLRFDILETVYYPLKRFELSYYRNQVIHLFVSESILSAVMYATIKTGGPIQSQKISVKKKLLKDCEFLSRLMKFEFVYGPGGLVNNMERSIQEMIKSNVVVVERDEETDDEMITLSPEERRTGREKFDFYCFLIWPFVETYWLTAVSLYTILPKLEDSRKGFLHWFDLKVFINRAQVFGKTLYYEGDVSYYESVSKETIANAAFRLKEMGLVKIHKGQSPPVYSKYEPSEYSTNINTSWIALSIDW
jgi:glycerol-3-phosphate O-acyltransferase